MGGALALGAYTDPRGLDSVRAQRDLKTAKALTYTCYQMYARTKTGISPEFMNFKGDQDDMQVPSSASFYILRPEAVEVSGRCRCSLLPLFVWRLCGVCHRVGVHDFISSVTLDTSLNIQ